VHKQGVVVGLTSDGTQGKATLQASQGCILLNCSALHCCIAWGRLRPLSQHQWDSQQRWPIVFMQGGEVLDFHYALLASGSSYASAVKPGPTRMQARESRLLELYDTSLKVTGAGLTHREGGESAHKWHAQPMPARQLSPHLVDSTITTVPCAD
jgi:hypothetical protein